MVYRKKQSRFESAVEQIVSSLFVFLVALVSAELFVYDMFGVEISTNQNIGVATYFMMQNTFIRYLIRRTIESRAKHSIEVTTK